MHLAERDAKHQMDLRWNTHFLPSGSDFVLGLNINFFVLWTSLYSNHRIQNSVLTCINISPAPSIPGCPQT